MVDTPLSQRLTQRIVRPSVSHQKHEVGRLLPSDFSGMPTYQKLNFHCAANPGAPISWQLPLPYDVVYHITNSYLLDVRPTLYNLGRTCRSLAVLCRPILFRTVTISTKGRKSPTACEKLAAILSGSPDIIDYIQTLRVLDGGKIFQESRPITAEEECLCYILTRPYPNLKRFELSLSVVWTLLPAQVQHAFGSLLSLPSLQELSLKHVRIPVDLLSYLPSLESLEIRGEISPPCGNDAYPNTQCTPKTLKYFDPSISGSISESIFSSNSTLLLDKLEHLEVCAAVHNLKFLQAHFQNHYRTLTTLIIHPLTGVRTELSPIDLTCLAYLKSLVLYAYISENTYDTDTLTLLGIDRNGFGWMLDTLRTCPQPSLLESVELVLQSADFVYVQGCPWEELERVLHPRLGWQQLKELHIRYNGPPAGNQEAYVDNILLPKMPVLAGAISIRVTISHSPSIHRSRVR